MPEKKLADRLREAIRLRGYSIRTEKAYVSWYEKYVRFHKLRHPSTMGIAEVQQFLSHLASEQQVAASTQTQALSALLFLYQEVINIPLGDIHALRAKKSTCVQPYLSTMNVFASSAASPASPTSSPPCFKYAFLEGQSSSSASATAPHSGASSSSAAGTISTVISGTRSAFARAASRTVRHHSSPDLVTPPPSTTR